MSTEFFRAGVGAIIINGKGEVLAFQRSDIPDAWQLPQGGLHKTEDIGEALFREVFEETGIRREFLDIVTVGNTWIGYEFPEELQLQKNFRGQVHKWFLLRFTGEEGDINLEIAPDDEFIAWKWMDFHELITKTIPFKRDTYRLLLAEFSDYLRRT